MASSASTSVKPLTILTEDDGVPGSKIEQDPQHYTVDQLKRWLKCRGLKQSGKREEIVQRVASCLQGPNHRILDVSIDGGKWFAEKVLKENEELKGRETFNEQVAVPIVPEKGWHSFPSQDIPSLFNYGHIYHYALESIQTVQLDPNIIFLAVHQMALWVKMEFLKLNPLKFLNTKAQKTSLHQINLRCPRMS